MDTKRQAVFPILILALLLFHSRALADSIQHLELAAGWNAIWLEVTPTAASPEKMFAGTCVDIVAEFFPAISTVEFISDPSEAPWKGPGWAVWYAPGSAEAALNSLTSLDGGRAYLVHCRETLSLDISGEPVCTPLLWTANSLNFVGLPVDPEQAPTFAAFFAGSQAHADLRIYQLSGGVWRRLSSPASVRIERGRAYWIYCRGRSRWQGPLELSGGSIRGLDFGAGIDTLELQIANRGTNDLHTSFAVSEADLPLCTVSRTGQALTQSYEPLGSGRDLGIVEPGAAVTLRLQVRREQMRTAEQEAILTVRGGGCLRRLPVRAERGTP